MRCLLLLTIFISSIAIAEPPMQETKEQVCASGKPAIQQLVKVGLIRRWDEKWNQVFVDKGWYAVEFQDKEKLMQFISICYSSRGRLSVKDAFSGKQVGEVDPYGTITVHQ